MSCYQKKVDVAQKSVSCRQKQDDAESKKYFVRKNVTIFPQRRAIINGINLGELNLKG